MQNYKGVLISFLVILSIMSIGILGFVIIEGWSILDSLYMTVTTMSTVGYAEIRNLSNAGRVFNIIFILLSISAVAYGISNIVAFVVDGKLNSLFKERRMIKNLASMKDHYIVCGAGQTGHAIIEELTHSDVPYVVIDKHKEIIDELQAKNIIAIQGDTATEEIMRKAGIEIASKVIIVHSTDAENLFAVLTCRQMNPNIFIVARAIDKLNEQKVMKCGANVVVTTSEIGGHRMAALALNPAVVGFLDVVQKKTNDLSASVIEFFLTKHSSLIGMTHKEADVRNTVGANILAVYREKETIFNPELDELFVVGDKLLIFGSEEQINKFKVKYGA